MTTTFENAKVGDRVWHLHCKWGTIRAIRPDKFFPIEVKYDTGGEGSFTLSGVELITNDVATLFWDEVTIIAPPKPLPKLAVDTKVLVWNTHGDTTSKTKRYFSHFSSSGNPCCFFSGRSSFTKESDADWIEWDKYELAEGGEA